MTKNGKNDKKSSIFPAIVHFIRLLDPPEDIRGKAWMKYNPFFKKKECTDNKGGSGQRRWISTEMYRDAGLEPGETFCLCLSRLKPRFLIHLLCPDSPRLSWSTLVDGSKTLKKNFELFFAWASSAPKPPNLTETAHGEKIIMLLCVPLRT